MFRETLGWNDFEYCHNNTTLLFTRGHNHLSNCYEKLRTLHDSNFKSIKSNYYI